jgi:thiamine-phosphate pyrophosphorylase
MEYRKNAVRIRLATPFSCSSISLMKPLSDCRLYGILDSGYCAPAAMPAVLAAMLRGGIDIVQLRAKALPPDRILELARELHPLSLAAGVPFIINDHPSLAAEAGVEGVHVGQDDLSVSEARRLAGAGRIVGLSTHSLAQVQAALQSDPDYIGFGPLFSTATKPDYTPIGTQDIAEAHRLAPFPVFCIGGIKRENLRAVITAGARRAVIVSGILADPEPENYVRDCTVLLRISA